MKILAIEASAVVCSVAVSDGETILGEYTVNNKKTHSQMLLPMIKSVMDSLSLTMEDIDVVACSEGPGSFTGIRIGIATAKGLASPRKIPVCTVPTLEAMAYNLPFCKNTVVPIMDARRNQVYCAAYAWQDGEFEQVLEPAAKGIDAFLSELENICGSFTFVGDGVGAYEGIIKDRLGERAAFSKPNASLQNASSVCALACRYIKENKLKTYLTAQPVYLRKSQAEREYAEKHGEK